MKKCTINGDTFIPHVIKEICIIDVVSSAVIAHWLLKIPDSVLRNHQLDDRQCQYMTRYFHHLPFFTRRYEHMRCPVIPNGSIILVKGRDKMMNLKFLYPACIVLDPFSSSLPTLTKIIKEHRIPIRCSYFNHGPHCALIKAYTLCALLHKRL